MRQSDYCIHTINRVGVGRVRVGTPPRATARVPTPLHTTPALTMTKIESSSIAYHSKGGGGVEWGGDPRGRPGRLTAYGIPSCTYAWGGGDPCGRPRGVAYAAKGHHGVRALTLALLFAFTLFLFPFSTSAHAASNVGTGRIYGQLLDGTKLNTSVAGQSLTLQMAQGDSARDLTNATTDAHGMFSFSGLDTDKTINYAVYTLYQGAQYNTDLIDLSTRQDQQINLTVYDATKSIASIAIVQANVLIDKVDAQHGLVTVAENFFFENLGLTTYVGSLQANGGMPNALRFSLPNKARKLSLSSGFNGYHVIQVDSGFATDAALPPGTSQFAFSFQVPYTNTSYDFAYTVVYPTVDLSLLVPLDIHASSSGLDSQGLVNANQHTYQQF